MPVTSSVHNGYPIPGCTTGDNRLLDVQAIKNALIAIDGLIIPGSGAEGPQGPAGPQGPQGATGPQGPAGADGGNYTLPVASASTLGGVKQGTNITIAGDGTISAIISGGGGGGSTAETLPGTTLASGIIESSLTKFGQVKHISLDQSGTAPLSAGMYQGGNALRLVSANGTFEVRNSSNTSSYLVIDNSNGIAHFSSTVNATTFVGALTGNASTATNATNATNAALATKSTNLNGGVAGAIPFQASVDVTHFTNVGAIGQVLTSNGAAPPTWQDGGVVNAQDISGTTLASNVTRSSLTSLGSLVNVSLATGTAPQFGMWYDANGVQIATTTSGGFSVKVGGSAVFSVSGAGAGTFVNSLTALSFIGNLTGNASTATTATNATNATNATTAANANHLAGGSGGKIPYQSAVGVTAFSAAGLAGQSLLSNGANAPTWGIPAVATTSNTTSDLLGGTNGNLVYQSGINNTSFVTNGTSGQILQSNGNAAPSWINVPVQTTVANIAGGSAGNVAYQTSAGNTAFTNTGTAGQILQSNGTGAPTWVDNSSGGFTFGTTNIISGTTIASFEGVKSLGFATSGGAAPAAGYPGIYSAANLLNFVPVGSGYAFKNNANDTTLFSLNNGGTATFLDTVTAAGFIGNASSATTALKTTNIAGGSAGRIPYQYGGDATDFTAVGVGGQFLTSGGNGAPSWTTVNLSTLGGVASSLLGAANGVATLNASGLVPSSQLPSYVDDVIEVSNFASLPGTGETGKIYITVNDNKQFRWSGSVYNLLVASPGTTDAITEGTTNLFFTPARAIAAAGFTGTYSDIVATNSLKIGTLDVATKIIPPNSKSVDYTCVLSDSGKSIYHPSSDTTARTYTIPSNTNVAYDVGTALTFINDNGAGVITIAIQTDTMRLSPTGTTGSRTLAVNGIATAIKVTATSWLISGSGLS